MMQALAVLPRDPHAERWQEWQAAYPKSNREEAGRAVVVVPVLFAALAVTPGRPLFIVA